MVFHSISSMAIQLGFPCWQVWRKHCLISVDDPRVHDATMNGDDRDNGGDRGINAGEKLKLIYWN